MRSLSVISKETQMVTIIRVANGNWQIHYMSELGQRYEEFKTFAQVTEFVDVGL
jgi:hypothetical protein